MATLIDVTNGPPLFNALAKDMPVGAWGITKPPRSENSSKLFEN